MDKVAIASEIHKPILEGSKEGRKEKRRLQGQKGKGKGKEKRQKLENKGKEQVLNEGNATKL